MAKKKSISKHDIIVLYMDYVLEHNEQPKSVYIFSKANNFEEAKFYEFFASFEAVQIQIFKTFFDNTISTLNKSEDYLSFDARNKLLSFYFTFFENLTANRSYVVHALYDHKNTMKGLTLLSKLRNSFMLFIDDLNIETLDIKQEEINKLQKRALQESAWLQLLLTIKFWLEDTSPSFEKTDIFIEKSVNTSFDVFNIAPLKSVIDFGKFLYKEKMHMT